MVSTSIVLEIRRLAVTEPLLGIASATYRRSLDYIPSTQIFGWIVQALTLLKTHRSIDDKMPTQSTMLILDLVLDQCKHVELVEPGLPLIQRVAEDVVRRFVRTLRKMGFDILAKDLEDRVSEATPYLLGLVEVPKFVPGLDTLKERGITHVPLVLLPLATFLKRAVELDEELAKLLRMLSLDAVARKRFCVGIALDRIRRGAAYGKFYSYQYLYTPRTFVAHASITKGIGSVVEALQSLGLGFKKSVALTQMESVVFTVTRRDPYVTLLELSRSVMDTMLSSKRDSINVAIYVYGDALTPLLFEPFKEFVGGLERVWIDSRRSMIYLAITNSFYVLEKKDRIITVAGKGSYATYTIPSERVEELRKVLDTDIGKHLEDLAKGVRVRKVKIHEKDIEARGPRRGNEVEGLEKELVLRKVFSTLRNIVVIPFVR